MPLSTIDLALLLILLAQVVGFCAFAWDKQMARLGGWRTPEAQLLLFVLLGGFGAWIGQHALRHKTRKEPFRTRMGVVLTLHLALLAGGALYVIL